MAKAKRKRTRARKNATRTTAARRTGGTTAVAYGTPRGQVIRRVRGHGIRAVVNHAPASTGDIVVFKQVGGGARKGAKRKVTTHETLELTGNVARNGGACFRSSKTGKEVCQTKAVYATVAAKPRRKRKKTVRKVRRWV